MKISRIKILLIVSVILLPLLFFGQNYLEKKMFANKTEAPLLSNEDLLLTYNPLIQELKKTVYVSDYFVKWRWDKNMIEATILEVDESTDDLVVVIKRPIGTIVGKGKLRTHISCTSEKTILVSMETKDEEANIVVKKTDFKVTDIAKKGQLIYTYCLSQDCGNVGNICILRNN